MKRKEQQEFSETMVATAVFAVVVLVLVHLILKHFQ